MTWRKIFTLSSLVGCLIGAHSFYFAEKIFQIDGLGLVAVKPFSQHRLPFVRHRGCRHGDDGYGFRLWIGPELLESHNSIHYMACWAKS